MQVHRITAYSDNQYRKDINNFSPLTVEEETKLVKQMKLGDIRARNELVESQLKLINYLARCFHKRFQDSGISVDDLIEEGNLKILEKIKGFDPERETKLRDFTWTCVTNTFFSFVRKSCREIDSREVPLPDNETDCFPVCLDSPSEQLIQEETKDLITKKINELPHPQAEIIRLRFKLYPEIDPTSRSNIKEIGETLGLSFHQVRRKLTNGLKALRSEPKLIKSLGA